MSIGTLGGGATLGTNTYTGPQYLPSGSAAAPSLSFSASTTSGFYRAGANIIGTALNGVQYGWWDTSNNFAFGNSGATAALGQLTSGTNNLALGSRAGASVSSAVGHILIGLDAGMFITTGAGVTNSTPNVAVGYAAGKYMGSAAQNGGNVALGAYASGGNSTYGVAGAVYSMVAVGEYALSSAGGTQKDTAVGSGALQKYLRGGQNSAFGRGTALNLYEGSYNVFAGHAPAFYNTYTVQSIAIGDSALNAWNAAAPFAEFTASQSGTTLTVTAISAGSIKVDTTVVSTTATALASNARVVSQLTGSAGSTGTYQLSVSQTVASQTMASGPGGTYNVALGALAGPLGYNDSYGLHLGPGAVSTGDHMTVIGNAQTAATISGRLAVGTASSAIANAAGVTYSVTQFLGAVINRSGANAVSDTTPTAAQIVAGIPGAEAGSTVFLEIVNTNTGLLTLVAGDAGVTLSGTTTVATVFTRRYRIRVTNAGTGTEAVTFQGISTAAN